MCPPDFTLPDRAELLDALAFIDITTIRYSGFYWALGHDYTVMAKYNETGGGTTGDSRTCFTSPCETAFQVPANCDVQKVDIVVRSNGWIAGATDTYHRIDGAGQECGSMSGGHTGGTPVDRQKANSNFCYEVWWVWPSGYELYMGDWCLMT